MMPKSTTENDMATIHIDEAIVTTGEGFKIIKLLKPINKRVMALKKKNIIWDEYEKTSMKCKTVTVDVRGVIAHLFLTKGGRVNLAEVDEVKVMVHTPYIPVPMAKFNWSFDSHIAIDIVGA
jgi:hypothetical protein